MKSHHNPSRLSMPVPCGRILIVEEALHSVKGHWFEYVKAIATTCRTAGDEVSVVAHQGADREIIDELRAKPLLAQSAWDRTIDSKNPVKRYAGVLLHNWRLYRCVDRVLRGDSKSDCIVVPTLLIHHLLAWTLLAHKHRGIKFNRMVLLFVNGQGIYRGPTEPPHFPRNPKTMLFRFLLQRLRGLVHSGHVVLATETAGMAGEYFAFCGVPFRCLPHPVQFSPSCSPRRKDSSPGMLTFGCFGFARHEKGSDLLQRAILAIRARRPDLRLGFRIQWLDDFRLPDGSLQARDPALLEDPDVEFITRPLNTSDYHRYLDTIDAMVLPYRASSYYARVSRVAIEAAIVGLPLVYTRGTWMEELVSEFGAGVGFCDENIEDLVSAILKMATDIEPFKSAGQARRERARNHFSAEHFRRWLLGSLPPTISIRTETASESRSSLTPIISSSSRSRL